MGPRAASWLAASRPLFIWLRAEVSRCLRWASGGATRTRDVTRPTSKSANMKWLSHSSGVLLLWWEDEPSNATSAFIRRVSPAWESMGDDPFGVRMQSHQLTERTVLSGACKQQETTTKASGHLLQAAATRPFPSKLIYFTLLMNFAAVPLVRPGPRGSITRGNLMLVDPA